MKTAGLILVMLLVLPGIPGVSSLFASPVAGNDAGVFVPGRFMSLAGAPDGSVYLLTETQQLVRVTGDGNQTTISLPRVFESKPTDRFCDLAVDGNSVALCGFAFPVLFVLDLQKPSEYSIVRASDQEAASLHLLNVSRDNEGWRVRDAEGYVFRLKNEQPLSRMPDFSALEAGENSKAIVLPPPRSENDLTMTGRVQKEDGRLLWVAPTPPAPRKVMSVDFLGVDPAGRTNFVVMTASGELDSEFTVYAVLRGQIVASASIPGPYGLEMQRFCRLAPDGSIIYAQSLEKGKEGILLKRLRLEGKN
ncbi:MAG: hypothetical protein A2W80_05420 [Candidatus Riflebacteria bacterium GWC2_50_8]|nr:MAG: hypothetical protein A2W80_05420 [Candidatus Riflebacteria bacterium GWC2_50_8]